MVQPHCKALYGVAYGSLGAAVGLLFYLYLSASVVLLGTEVNAAIYRLGGGTQGEKRSLDRETSDAEERRTRDG